MKNNNPSKPSKYIEYIDENYFYGRAMSGYFPYAWFEWLKNVDIFMQIQWVKIVQ